jgi:phage terminase large subunit-like protein
LVDPQTKKLFVLLAAELAFLGFALRVGANGRLEFSEWIYSAPRKSGKTTFAAALAILMLILNLGEYPEIIIVANSRQQAEDQVFKQICRIIECSPLLRDEAKVGRDRISIGDGTIRVISTDVGSAAGSEANLVIVDELWAVDSENGRRLFHELSPPPTRKKAARLVVSYAGFESELLHELYLAGLEQPLVGKDLHAGNNTLMFWAHEPIAEWQDETWLANMRRTLPEGQYTRQIENRFTSGSEQGFVSLQDWDACVVPELAPAASNKSLPLWVAIDASWKHDATAIIACTRSQNSEQVRIAFHKVFRPPPSEPLDFERTIEATILDLARRFQLYKVRFDPNQMVATSQRLQRAGIPVEEFPQSPANLNAATSNLLQLIRTRHLIAYPSSELRDAISRATVKETTQGVRLVKTKSSDKIDVVVALSMAALATVEGRDDKAAYYLHHLDRAFGPDTESRAAKAIKQREQENAEYHRELMARFGQPVSLMARELSEAADRCERDRAASDAAGAENDIE